MFMQKKFCLFSLRQNIFAGTFSSTRRARQNVAAEHGTRNRTRVLQKINSNRLFGSLMVGVCSNLQLSTNSNSHRITLRTRTVFISIESNKTQNHTQSLPNKNSKINERTNEQKAPFPTANYGFAGVSIEFPSTLNYFLVGFHSRLLHTHTWQRTWW